MSTTVKVLNKPPKLKDPILVEGLPGIGNVGRVAVKYLVEKLGATKFAELYSNHFYPFVTVHSDNKVHVMKNEFFYWKAKKKNQNDLIFITGDSQSATSEGHYEISEKILDLAEELGAKFLITTGGLQTGEVEDNPKVVAAVSDKDIIQKYKGLNVQFDASERVGTIVGASGLIVGLGALRGIKGICLLGETAGMPILTDPKAAEAILKVVNKIIGVDVDLNELDAKVREMENFIKKIEMLQRKAMQQIEKKGPGGDEEVEKYIG
jgi:uncharacterized protein